MTTIKFFNNKSSIRFSHEWRVSKPLGDKRIFVDCKGCRVGVDYSGRKYRIIEEKERQFSTLERFERGLLGVVAVICTLSLGLFLNRVRVLFTQSEETILVALLESSKETKNKLALNRNPSEMRLAQSCQHKGPKKRSFILKVDNSNRYQKITESPQNIFSKRYGSRPLSTTRKQGNAVAVERWESSCPTGQYRLDERAFLMILNGLDKFLRCIHRKEFLHKVAKSALNIFPNQCESGPFSIKKKQSAPYAIEQGESVESVGEDHSLKNARLKERTLLITLNGLGKCLIHTNQKGFLRIAFKIDDYTFNTRFHRLGYPQPLADRPFHKKRGGAPKGDQTWQSQEKSSGHQTVERQVVLPIPLHEETNIAAKQEQIVIELESEKLDQLVCETKPNRAAVEKQADGEEQQLKLKNNSMTIERGKLEKNNGVKEINLEIDKKETADMLVSALPSESEQRLSVKEELNRQLLSCGFTSEARKAILEILPQQAQGIKFKDLQGGKQQVLFDFEGQLPSQEVKKRVGLPMLFDVEAEIATNLTNTSKLKLLFAPKQKTLTFETPIEITFKLDKEGEKKKQLDDMGSIKKALINLVTSWLSEKKSFEHRFFLHGFTQETEGKIKLMIENLKVSPSNFSTKSVTDSWIFWYAPSSLQQRIISKIEEPKMDPDQLVQLQLTPWGR